MREDTKPEISTLDFKDFLTELQNAVDSNNPDQGPAFTLILGAGFSNGLIPTAYEMAMNDIPWWMGKTRDLEQPFTRAPSNNPDFIKRRNELWKKIKDEQPRNKNIPDFGINPDGSPKDDADNIALCYKAIMCASSGLNSQKDRCAYLRDAVKRTDNEINYAHLFLAGILYAQRTKAWRKEYGHKHPFCRTILSTNFDNLLQRSLQLNNQLYFVSDQPENHFDTPDDQHEAVHLIQTHGSIFRPFVANSAAEIEKLKENAGAFKDYLGRHGVIVIGYGGWDDAIMKALMDCKHFAGNLYWCDLHPVGEWHKLRSNVTALLEKHSDDAFYVPLRGKDGADYAMRDLHMALGLENYPRVLIDPLPNLIESIKGLRLPESLGEEKLRKKSKAEKCGVQGIGDLDNPKAVKGAVIELLTEFQGEFTNPKTATGKMVLAYASAISSEEEKAVALWSEVAGMADATAKQKTRALYNRGVTKGQNSDAKGEMEDYTQVIEMADAPAQQKAKALVNRGVTKGQNGDAKGAMEDYTQVIKMDDAAVELKVNALIYRGVTKGQNGDAKGEMEDYTQVIKMDDVPADLKATALVNRGDTRYKNGDYQGALSDANAAILCDGITREDEARAYTNRAEAKYKLGVKDGARVDVKHALGISEIPDNCRKEAEKVLDSIEKGIPFEFGD